ncbi:MAG: hypothetical protein HY020_19210 [Burkholderiales bacterium]|nr:hypothetical protein [Burkholderiales bacterium]
MKTWNLRPLTLSAALLALMTLTAPASAQDPTVPAVDRSALREAHGDYVLDDGRTLKVQVGARRLSVGLDEHPLELWRAENADLLVSPDGMRRLRLYRNVDGSVDRVALEIDRVR